MTLTNGEFEERSEEAILQALINDAKNYWGKEGEQLNSNELNVVETFYRPIAARLAETQQDIGLVLESSQLENAEGAALDLLTSLIGVQRDKAEGATGYVTFGRDDPAESLYVVPQGTRVQTRGSSPVEYETLEQVAIQQYDDFESGDIGGYSGDTTAFSVQSSVTLDGQYSLEGPATSGAQVQTRKEIQSGSKFQFLTQVETGAVSETTFAYSDQNNWYQITVDQSGRVALEVIEDSVKQTVSEDTAVTVPADEPIRVEVTWDRLGDFTLDFVRANQETKLTTLTGTDTTHESGTVGFRSGGSSGKKYWDSFASTEATARVRATATGVETNTAPETVHVMPDPPTGVTSVTNKRPITGGSERETDDELRERAKLETGKGARATLSALQNSVKRLDSVVSVSPFKVNNDADAQTDGFELVVQGGDAERIAQAILDNMAAGDTSIGGVNGTATSATADIGNGQSLSIDFSRPNNVEISVSADLVTTDVFSGREEVRDAVTEYIGGRLTSGNESAGLRVGEDVVFGEVEYAIRSVDGVYDVQNLTVDTSSTSGNTSNIQIQDSDVATTDATDGSLSFTTTQK